MERKIESIALFDMDGTLCDYNRGLREGLDKIMSPEEKRIYGDKLNNIDFHLIPKELRGYFDKIRASEEWWENLPKFQLGWDVLGVAQELDYRVMILTQGPRRNPYAWSGKKRWIDKNLGEDFDITITRDKGVVYGKVLVDDWPAYIRKWLVWRERGFVIMPANNHNINFKHPQVIRYDGNNLDEVRNAMDKVKLREKVVLT